MKRSTSTSFVVKLWVDGRWYMPIHIMILYHLTSTTGTSVLTDSKTTFCSWIRTTTTYTTSYRRNSTLQIMIYKLTAIILTAVSLYVKIGILSLKLQVKGFFQWQIINPTTRYSYTIMTTIKQSWRWFGRNKNGYVVNV